MTPTWALRLVRQDIDALASLRLCRGVQVAECEGELWLTGDARQAVDAAPINSAPALERFDVIDGRLLVPAGHVAPTRRLPDADWQPIERFLIVASPAMALPGRLRERVQLRLERRPGSGEPNVLRTRIEDLCGYVDDLPGVRIAAWRLAMNAQGDVIVTGTPLPSLPGEQFIAEEGIALPLGYGLEPCIDRLELRNRLAVSSDELVIAERDGGWLRIPAESFVVATRESIRASAQEVAGA